LKYRASIIVKDPKYLGNKWFSDDPSVIRDNQNACYIALRDVLSKNGIDLATEDVNKPEDSDLVIRLDVSRDGYRKRQHQKSYLFLIEPPVVNKYNWDRKYHSGYDRVFTWNDSLVDGKNYFLLRLAYKLRFDGSIGDIHRKKLCSMIIGYKFSRGSSELYSERLAAINWFTRNHPEDFEYYGEGWPSYLFPYFGTRMAGLFPVLESRMPKSILERIFPKNTGYRGRAASKSHVLNRFKFSICYENMHSVPGLITEKIFDSFSAGCVPVYLGASNVAELIPAGCFIDRRGFKNYGELYKFMTRMEDRTYLNYLNNIEYFIHSNAAKVFSADHFANTLARYILEDIC
jgi:hypothetical protein